MDPVTLLTWRVPKADAAILEAATVPECGAGPGLEQMRRRLGVPHLFYLATCQRVIWVLEDAPEDAGCRLQEAYAELWGTDVPAPDRHDRFDAFQHLCTVASSLDALVPGEPQVLGQVRDAVRQCDGEGLLGPGLRHLFDHVLRTAKEVRAQTGLFRGKVSLLPLAEEPVREALSGPAPTAAVLGTGEIGMRTVRFLRRIAPDVRLQAVSRDDERARAFAAEHDAQPRTLEAFLEAPAPDLVMCAMDVQRPVLSGGHLASWAEAQPLTVVDLALPRNTERPPGAPDLTLIQMDDLMRRREASLARREAAYADAQRILADAVDRVRHEYDLRCHASTLHRLTRRFEEVAELRWKEAMLAGDDNVRKWYDQTVRALLHEAVEVVKGTDRSEEQA